MIPDFKKKANRQLLKILKKAIKAGGFQKSAIPKKQQN